MPISCHAMPCQARPFYYSPSRYAVAMQCNAQIHPSHPISSPLLPPSRLVIIKAFLLLSQANAVHLFNSGCPGTSTGGSAVPSRGAHASKPAAPTRRTWAPRAAPCHASASAPPCTAARGWRCSSRFRRRRRCRFHRGQPPRSPPCTCRC